MRREGREVMYIMRWKGQDGNESMMIIFVAKCARLTPSPQIQHCPVSSQLQCWSTILRAHVRARYHGQDIA